MTAQEWLDELERLRKAAIMPPYYLRKKLFFGAKILIRVTLEAVLRFSVETPFMLSKDTNLNR